MHRRVAIAEAVLISWMMASTLSSPALGQFEKVTIKTAQVAERLYMLEGLGGNLAALVGPDGIFLVDNQFAPLAEKIRRALAKLSDQPLRFVINTHSHFDHTGGNEVLGRAGAVVVAHENVRKRMSTEQLLRFFPRGDRAIPASSAGGLPIVTFTKSVSFYVNGETIEVLKAPSAHTDGDSIVRFMNADVLHVGDIYRNGYPYIDIAAGGSLDGTIKATDFILSLMGPRTKVISGHSPVATRREVQAFKSMLEAVKDRIQRLIKQGKPIDEILTTKPLADLDVLWGGGFIKADLFLKMVHADLTGS